MASRLLRSPDERHHASDRVDVVVQHNVARPRRLDSGLECEHFDASVIQPELTCHSQRRTCPEGMHALQLGLIPQGFQLAVGGQCALSLPTIVKGKRAVSGDRAIDLRVSAVHAGCFNG